MQKEAIKNVHASGDKLKCQHKIISSHEDGFPRGIHDANDGVCFSMSIKKKTENNRMKPRNLFDEGDIPDKIQKVTHWNETPLPSQKSSQFGRTRNSHSHGHISDKERQYTGVKENITISKSYSLPLATSSDYQCKDFEIPEKSDQQEDINTPPKRPEKNFGSPFIRNFVNQPDGLQSTFGVITPASNSSLGLMPKAEIMEKALGFRPLQSKRDHHDDTQTESSDDEEKLKGTLIGKTSYDMKDKEASQLEALSDDSHLGSSGEDSPTSNGFDWNGESNWTPISSENNQVDGLARAFELLLLGLEKIKRKTKAVTSKRSSGILMSVAEDVHMQLQNVESHIQMDVGKLKNLNKSKQKCIGTRFEEQQELLQSVYDIPWLDAEREKSTGRGTSCGKRKVEEMTAAKKPYLSLTTGCAKSDFSTTTRFLKKANRGYNFKFTKVPLECASSSCLGQDIIEYDNQSIKKHLKISDTKRVGHVNGKLHSIGIDEMDYNVKKNSLTKSQFVVRYKKLKPRNMIEGVIESPSFWELEKQTGVAQDGGERHKTLKRKRENERKENKKQRVEYTSLDHKKHKLAIFQYEGDILSLTSLESTKSKLGYIIASDKGVAICMKIHGKTYETRRILSDRSLRLKYKSTGEAEVNKLLGRFELQLVPHAFNRKIQPQREEIGFTMPQVRFPASALCSIRCIELIISLKFGKPYLTFSSQEVLDVFSPPIEGRYDLYVKDHCGPSAENVLKYVCERGVVPSTNYSFTGFRSFFSFNDLKQLAIKILEVKGREHPLIGFDCITCPTVLNETRALSALVTQSPVMVKFEVGKKFCKWNSWEIYNPKIDIRAKRYEYVIVHSFDEKVYKKKKTKFWVVSSCRGSSWGKNGQARVLRSRTRNPVLEALRPILNEDWRPNGLKK